MSEITVSGNLNELHMGDFITIAGHFKKRPWWKFWLWFKPKKLQEYRITEVSKSNCVITIEGKYAA